MPKVAYYYSTDSDWHDYMIEEYRLEKFHEDVDSDMDWDDFDEKRENCRVDNIHAIKFYEFMVP